MRREFELREDDEAALRDRRLAWETVKGQGETRWLLIHEYPICGGYNHARATAALRLERGYPDTQIDMVYFDPPLARADGKPINNLTIADVAGRQYQQWSRHRTAANAWRSGVDGVGTQLLLVDDWLEREFKLR